MGKITVEYNKNGKLLGVLFQNATALLHSDLLTTDDRVHDLKLTVDHGIAYLYLLPKGEPTTTVKSVHADNKLLAGVVFDFNRDWKVVGMEFLSGTRELHADLVHQAEPF